MQWYSDKQLVSSVDDLITGCPDVEFESATRSTVPLLDLLNHNVDVFDALVHSAMGPAEDTTEVHHEYTVVPPLGKGKASHTDLMAVDGEASLAIEVKWTEPRYQTVRQFLDEGGGSENRDAVLAGWLSLLQPHATTALSANTFAELPYQLVHRAASACDASANPALSYLRFLPVPGKNLAPSAADLLLQDLEQAHAALGSPSDFPFLLIDVEVVPTDAFAALADLPKGSNDTASAVRKALLADKPLFAFPSVTVVPIGSSNDEEQA